MNIWLLTTEYPPDYGGGIATYAQHTAHMLAQRGHYVTVFASSEAQPPGERSEETAGRIRIVRFGLNQTPHSAALDIPARWSYDAAEVVDQFLQREGPPDVLESQEYLGLPYFVLQRRWLLEPGFRDLPVLVTAHTPLYLCYRYDRTIEHRFPGYWLGEMERFSLIAAQGVVFPSNYLRQEILRELPQVEEFSRCITYPYRSAQAECANSSVGARRGFLFLAKIERRKGIEPLLAAFRRLWDQGLEDPLVILGSDWFDEVNQRWMWELISKRYQTYVERGLLEWRGKQPPEVVHQTLSQVRAIVLPSLFENYPYAILEGMGAGVPAVVSCSGGHAEIVEDGVSGFVFSHDSKGDLEAKVRALLNLSQERWQEMSAAARARVQWIADYDRVGLVKEEFLQWVMNHRRERRAFPFLRGTARGRPVAEETKEIAGLLSVVIPFYNLGAYLEEALQSLATVDDIPLEIIIVDDGSDDPHSLAVLEALQGRYTFRLIRTANQGLASARNAGAGQAHGEFLTFLDADDRVDGRYYREALEILRYYEDIHFVGCWAEYFGEAKGWWPTWNPEPPYALAHNPLNTSALVYRRSAFLKFGLNDPSFDRIMEDYDSLLSLIANGCRGVSIPRPYFKYRVRAKSMYHNTTVLVKVKTYEQLCRKHVSLYRDYAAEVFALVTANGPGYLYDNPTQRYPQVQFVQPVPVRVCLAYALRAILQRPYHWLIGRVPSPARLGTGLRRRLSAK